MGFFEGPIPQRTGTESCQGASQSKKWNFADEMSFIHKFLRERETRPNMVELECDSEYINNQRQVEYSTEDVADDEDRKATTEHTQERTMDMPERRTKELPSREPSVRHHGNVCLPLNHLHQY
jgi:hypothetical protein